jgi:hypothetical protein
MLKLLKIAAATAVLAWLVSTGANAAGEKFCNDYAASSVEQFNRAQDLGISVSGPRWHGTFDLHKMWCRVVSKAAAQHEISARQAVIDKAEGAKAFPLVPNIVGMTEAAASAQHEIKVQVVDSIVSDERPGGRKNLKGG